MGVEEVQRKETVENRGKGLKDYLWFLIPSIIGVGLFMVPIQKDNAITIPVAFLAKQLQGALDDHLPAILTIMLAIVVVLSCVATLFKPNLFMKNGLLKSLFVIHPMWLVVRVLGFIFAFMTLLQLGPEAVWSEGTGALLLYDLLPLLFTIFLFAGLFLPFLLNFGLLELFGVLLNKFMRPVFTLPGRSSIDCLASWMGDGTIGVLLTNKQYEEGFYTQREAAVISTTFSVVSITFSIVVLAYMDLEHLFLPYYLTIVLAGLAAAIVLPRIPPLSRKRDTYLVENPDRFDESASKGRGMFAYGMTKALERARQNRSVKNLLQGGMKNVFDMWFAVIPVIMAIGTVAVIFAEYTSLFKIVGAPFVPILQLLQVPEAHAAAQTMVVGFADMFLPAIIGSGIESDLTRFVIACVSVTQLIYMSEVGGLIIASKLPVKFIDLVLIFLLRTIITLPIIVGMAHLIF
ncbi:YjiH family protein [Halalkalibacterium halodurans]|uniref:BH3947 protein n=1 Tax=Halalkalibacterium halodurans (strain ATCC BAA-125 / DSM 18197 / FERM 7344 / JCM 9153 / C-125) TaxID=272558 RepID=Q9K5Y8_HALH5|nr:YjiH family protein [Halalkalibacterium halodurans]MDY7224465.1 YjiH family protein [Halalkalibacterium halodurans]MDY7243750.1 YjiH family protein [Halalkalibacterium halodurans]MED4079660.1 YjiH family protein [Halalkalibacterium halodurans]MED4084064.1 YjiH family protein [Halalkalibacterium halodurans]MED4104542.1 YjiH family protein [Halalkalibacterium halodurans]